MENATPTLRGSAASDAFDTSSMLETLDSVGNNSIRNASNGNTASGAAPSHADSEQKSNPTWVFRTGGLLTDEEREKVVVEVYADPSEIEAKYDDDRNNREGSAEFNQYNHYHFDDVWDAYGDKSRKDPAWWIPDPQTFSEDDDRYLCEMCRHINFKALFTLRNLPGSELPGPAKIRLRHVDKIVRRERCNFCRLITRKITSDKVIDLTDEAVLKDIDITLNVIDEGEEHALRLEVELNEGSRRGPSPRWPTQRYIVQHWPSERKFLLFHACSVFDQIQSGMLRLWLEVCDSSHRRKLTFKAAVKKLRLVDVEQNCVREVDLPANYVCLSYIWGGTKHSQTTDSWNSIVREPNGLLNESIILPKTISDAMEVTRWLKIPYLWVDALCIEQDNIVDRQENISNMAAIFGGAILTIVASSNSTPLDGLPGVTTVPRTQKQIKENVQGIDMAVAFHDRRRPNLDIEQSKWNTRGWTYQERLLSERLVYFTESQMIFVCSETTLFEDTTPPILYDNATELSVHGHKSRPVDSYFGNIANPHRIKMTIVQDPTQSHFLNKTFKTDDGYEVLIYEKLDLANGYPDVSKLQQGIYEHKAVSVDDDGLLKVKGENMWNVYRKAVAAYTQRNLSDSRDIVPAFKGLAELIRQGSNVQFWLNLPSYAFDQALLWYPSKGPLVRRKHNMEDQHSSWSWAGWQGPVRYRGRGWYNSLHRRPVCAVAWFHMVSHQQFIEQYGSNLEMSNTSLADMFERRIPIADKIHPNKLFRFDQYQDAGWDKVVHRKQNQHAFLHDGHYPNVVFDYPICAPDEQITVIPDEANAIRFKAYCVGLRFSDMSTRSFTKTAYVDPFLQIGLNDLGKGDGPRDESWQRIIYHQGYRAGFLALNVAFSALDLDRPEKYWLVAMSRDELPQIHSSQADMTAYTRWGPVELQYMIGFRQYYHLSPEEFQRDVVKPPDESVEPSKFTPTEDFDPHWDVDRFGDDPLHIYNVLLVEDMGDGNGVVRIGVGKMRFSAFHHAKPVHKILTLR